MGGEQAFRDLMAAVCAQVTIVTATERAPFGTTMSAFTSLPLRPPMITVALDCGSRLLEPVLRTRRLGVEALLGVKEKSPVPASSSSQCRR